MQPGESPTAQTMKRFDQDGGSLSAASLMGTLLQGVDGIVLSCDPVAEQLLGYSARQLVGTTAFDPAWQTIHPDGSPFLPKQYPAIVALRSGKPCRNMVMGFYRPNGDLVWLCLNSTPLFQPDVETPDAVVTTFHEVPKPTVSLSSLEEEASTSTNLDPTEGKPEADVCRSIAERLQVSEQRFRRLADSMPHLVFAARPDGSITYANHFAQDYTGLSSELLEQGWATCVHPDDRGRALQTWMQAVQAGESYEMECRFRKADGTYRWLLSRRLPIRDREGQIIEWIGGSTDIHDRKEIEAVLRESNERFQTAMQAVDGIVFEWNLQTGYVYRSEGLLQLVGVRAEDAPPTRNWWAERIHPDDLRRIESSAASVMASGDRYQGEYRVRHEDGHWVEVWEQGYLKRNSQGDLIGVIGCTTNITERKQTEETLRLNRDRLAFVLRATGIGLWLNPLPLSSLTWDDRTKELFFIPPEVEPTIELFWSRVHPDDREPTRLAVEEALRDRTLYEIEHRAVHPDTGEIRWIKSSGKATYAPDGTPIRFDGINYDITDRRRAELNDQFLNQLDARLRHSSNADEMAWEVVSSIGRYLNVDRCMWNEIDSDAQIAIVKQDWYQQNHMPSVVGVYQLSDFALPDLISLYHQRQTVAVADVTTHPCTAPFVENYIPYGTHAYVAVPCVIQGIWVAMLVINASTPRNWRSDEVALLQEVVSRLWSIIEHTRAVEELRQSEVQFRQLANGMPQIVWVADANGTVEFTNDRWTEYTGLTLEQSRDPTVMRQIIPPEDYEQLQADFIQAREARSLYQSQFRLIQPNGSYLYFLTRAVPILNEQGQVHKWYGTSTDISDRVQIERDRERILQQEQAAREAAENANRIKDEFLAVLSHELRSPLNPILGWSKLLQQGKLDTARTKTALTTIERNAQLQAQLINDLLDISRILRGKLSLDQSAVDLSDVISSALETVRLAAEAKGIDLRFEVSGRVDEWAGERVDEHPSTHLPIYPSIQVIGDAGRLQQVVWNLLSNAVKFTPSTGQITVSLTQSESFAQIQVTDTGKGIHPDFLPYVFEHFRQEDGATTRKFGGLGLGLAIARQIVELHGGTIAVESAGEGQGATFTVQLPLTRRLGQLTATASPYVATDGDLHNIHILVVDDEPDSREFMVFVLEQAGAIVTSFASGIEALQVIERAAPDLIVSDIGMPEMDGYMLMQQVRRLEQGRTVPAIALTAYAGEFDRQQALQAGFQRHLSKPIEPEGLIQAIVALIHGAGGSHGNT